MKTFNFSLKYKLAFLLVILPALALGLYLLLAVTLFKKDKEAYIFDSSLSISRTLSAQVRATLLAESSILRSFLLGRGPDNKFTALSQERLKAEPEQEFISVLTPDPSGTIYNSFTELRAPSLKPEIYNEIQQTHSVDATDAREHGMKLRLLNKDGGDLVALTMRFGNREDPNTIIATACFHAMTLFNAFEQVQLYATYLIDSRGLVMGSSHNDLLSTNDFTDPKLFSESINKSPEGTASVKSPSNEDLLLSYSRIGTNEMYVITLIPKKVVFRAVQLMVTKSFLFLVGLILASIIASIFASGRLTANLARLMGAMKTIASGDLSVNFESKTHDEFEVLGGVFNQMTHDLKSSRDELVTLNQTLEEKVKERTRQLEEAAVTDALTGLRNRRYFNEKLKEELERARRYKKTVGIVYLDIDHFKKYNDGNGHPQGDELLKMFSKVISTSSRQTDCVCRLGGEEFCVILPETDIHGALICAEKIRAGVEATDFPFGEKQPLGRVTCSLGISSFPDFGQDEESLVKVADSCLYTAKEGGRNKVGTPHGINSLSAAS